MSGTNNTPSLHSRRQFMRTSMLGAAASMSLPIFLERTFASLDASASDIATQEVTGKDGEILVIVQLAGGNDGLNTLVPWADDAYYKARPNLAIKSGDVLKVNDYAGFNGNLTGLKGLYDDGHLSIVQGVGYPNPNRSHFRSTEIWQTASDADKTSRYGWLGRYFDSCCEGADPTIGVSVTNKVPQAFAAPVPKGISFSNPERYRWEALDRKEGTEEEFYRKLNRPDHDDDGGEMDNAGGSVQEVDGADAAPDLGPLDYLQRTALDAQLSSDRVLEIARKYKPEVKYPSSKLASSLSLVGRMIAGALPTRVYYVSQGGYDTHANQEGSHERLMTELDSSLSAFCADMKKQGNFDRVTIMTFSEFGRRVAENANIGTDHGAAAPLFVMGGGVKPGVVGKYPSLTELHRGDLVHTVDFRSVYASALRQRLGVDPAQVLGREFPLLDLFS